MANAFQRSAFQNNAFQGEFHVPPGGGNLRSLRGYIKRRRQERRELELACKLAEELERKARREGENELANAAWRAAEVVCDLEDNEAADTAKLAALTRELQAVAGAKTITAALSHARAIDEYVSALHKYLREVEDEEDAITLFLQ